MSKILNNCASQYLVRSVYISGFRKDQEAMKAISEHPVFANCVTELVFDISMLDVFDNKLITNEFKKCYRSSLLYRYFGELSEEGFSEEYWRYLKKCWEQHKSIETGSPVACLAAALPLLPNIRHFRVAIVGNYACEELFSSRSYEREERRKNFFSKLLSTLATTSIKRPFTSLVMELLWPGAFHGFLGIPHEDLGHWRNTFRHVRSLHLWLLSDHLAPRNLGRLLQPLRALETLR